MWAHPLQSSSKFSGSDGQRGMLDLVQIFSYPPPLALIYENEMWKKCIEQAYGVHLLNQNNMKYLLVINGHSMKSVSDARLSMQEVVKIYHEECPLRSETNCSNEHSKCLNTELEKIIYKHTNIKIPEGLYSKLPPKIITILLKWMCLAYEDNKDTSADDSVVILDEVIVIDDSFNENSINPCNTLNTNSALSSISEVRLQRDEASISVEVNKSNGNTCMSTAPNSTITNKALESALQNKENSRTNNVSSNTCTSTNTSAESEDVIFVEIVPKNNLNVSRTVKENHVRESNVSGPLYIIDKSGEFQKEELCRRSCVQHKLPSEEQIPAIVAELAKKHTNVKRLKQKQPHLKSLRNSHKARSLAAPNIPSNAPRTLSTIPIELIPLPPSAPSSNMPPVNPTIVFQNPPCDVSCHKSFLQPPLNPDSALSSRRLRPIVIDGSNVAVAHGRQKSARIFSCRGIELCIEYFQKKGHTDITAFVPRYRLYREFSQVQGKEILEKLEEQKLVVFTPSRRIGSSLISSYDDRFIVELASRNGGVIVSNDNYRDIMNESPEFMKTIRERLLMFCFAGDYFMIPQDPLGRNGPSLDSFLSFPD